MGNSTGMVVWLTLGFTSLVARPHGGHAQARIGPGGADSTAAGTVVSEGVSIEDGTGAPTETGMSIVVTDGRIDRIDPTSSIDPGQWVDAKTVDAGGLHVIPGLVESHTHVATIANRQRAEFILNRYVYGGITTARDMAGDFRALADLQRASLVGGIDAPDLHYSALVAGPSFWTDPRTIMTTTGEAPGVVPWSQTVTEETDARRVRSEAWPTVRPIRLRAGFAGLEETLVYHRHEAPGGRPQEGTA